jgi:hypothetical protein
MNLLNFESQYPDEASCKVKSKKDRNSQGALYVRIVVAQPIIG